MNAATSRPSCTCYDQAPTIPTCRGLYDHLDGCAAKGSGQPVSRPAGVPLVAGVAAPVTADAVLVHFGLPLEGTCAACGDPFAVGETRHTLYAPAHWVTRQQLGPIHAHCRVLPEAQAAALKAVAPDVWAQMAQAFDAESEPGRVEELTDEQEAALEHPVRIDFDAVRADAIRGGLPDDVYRFAMNLIERTFVACEREAKHRGPWSLNYGALLQEAAEQAVHEMRASPAATAPQGGAS